MELEIQRVDEDPGMAWLSVDRCEIDEERKTLKL
jgi:hypothetical protein